MEVVAIRKATVLFPLRLELMNPQRKGVLFTLVPKMIEHYRFLKYPRTFEETNLENGMLFEGGVWDGTAIEEVRIFMNGILIATGESTDRGEAVFNDMMTLWGNEVGLTYEPSMVGEKVYITQLVVRSGANLDQLNPAVWKILPEFFKGPTGFATVGFFTQGNTDAAPIRIERAAVAAGLPPTPDEYWTQSPLSTSRHLEFLQAFEEALGVIA
jgi:hypothetical protein